VLIFYCSTECRFIDCRGAALMHWYQICRCILSAELRHVVRCSECRGLRWTGPAETVEKSMRLSIPGNVMPFLFYLSPKIDELMACSGHGQGIQLYQARNFKKSDFWMLCIKSNGIIQYYIRLSI